TANSMVQLSVDPAMRGRVMALYMAVFMGGTPLASPLIGWIGLAWGPRWTILVGSFTTGLAVIAAMLYLVRSENIRVRFHLAQRPRLSVTRGEVIQPVPEMAR
ncbi:MAG: MFS transporter, partial [Dermatophilaceae bacterium]